MFDPMNFSNRENTIILLLKNGFELGKLAKEVKTLMGDLPRYSEEDETIEVFNPNDFSIVENIIIECLQNKVNINELFKIVEISTNEVEYGSSYSESVQIAINLSKTVYISVLDLNKMLNDAYYAGWNISREDYNSDSNPCEEDSSSFCYNRENTISSIIKNIK